MSTTILIDRFLQRPKPIFPTLNIHSRIYETGSYSKFINVERFATVKTISIGEAVLNKNKKDPGISTQKIASQINECYMRNLKIPTACPCHMKRVQALLLRNLPIRDCLLQLVI